MQHPHHSIRLLLLCAAALALAALALLPFTAHAQSISGVINTYQHVTFIDECLNTLHVESSAGFVKGDRILIIQMRGATIDETNSANYGSVLNVGGAGACEIAEVFDVPNGFTLRLKNALLSHYDVLGMVQAVKIPH